VTACSEAADEPLPGTATTAEFLLAVEQSGPYAGRDAVESSPLPRALGQPLAREVGRRGGRLLLIRRPGARPEQTHPTRRIFLSVARFPHTATWTADLADPLEALHWLDTSPPQGVRRLTEPVALVCTHGRRDVCCARRGRELLRGGTRYEVWESSHQGGHRFAPVVWDLTTGYQHGRVTPDDLAAIGRAAEAGCVHLPTARGHFALEAPMQAVDLAVRRAHGLRGLEAVQMRKCSGDGTYLVTTTDCVWTAKTTPRAAGENPKSCGAAPAEAHTYDVELTTK
jgi:hypothetical protein